jgi:2-polyprenyl-3-methyl-5-hydroxy-6-metoxy-1,4-benzoquinol methylase
MVKSVINSKINVPHRKYHDDKLSVQNFRDNEFCQFELLESSYGLRQKNLSYDYKELYESKEWITPAPQSSGLYFETSVPRTAALEKVLKSYKNKDLRVLEIGGGNIFIAEQISKLFSKLHVTCLDPSYESQKISENVELISGFFPSVLAKQKFDIIYSFNTIEHVPDVDSFLKCLYESMESDGSVILSFPECSKQIASGDWNLFSQQHVNYFVAPFFYDYFEKFGFYIKSYEVLFDEAIVTLGVKRDFKKIPSVFGEFSEVINELEINGRFLTKFLSLEIFFNSNKNRMSEIYVHGATSGIMNMISNFENSVYFWDTVQLVDNDPNKHGKFLSGFSNKIMNLSEIVNEPKAVLIGSETFFYSIKNSWHDIFPNNNIVFHIL